MNKCWILTKLFLKTGEESLSQNKKSKFQSKPIKYLFVALCCLPLAIMLGETAGAFYEAFAAINQQASVLAMGFAISCLLIFFFGIFYSMNTLYFSKDVEYIMPLPFKPWEIVTAKFTTMLIYEYLTEALFVLPLIISYGIKDGAGVLYYIYSLIIFLVLPGIPLILSSIIVMIIMSFTNIAKNKDRFRKISGIISLMLMLVLNGYMQKMNQKAMNPEKLKSMIDQGENGFITIMSRFFPTAKFAALGAANSSSINGLVNLGIFLLISILVLLIFIVLSEGLYFKGAIGMSETSSKRKKLSSKELNKNVVKQSMLMSYTKKELKLLFRTPTYFYNCVIMNFLWPVFFIIPVVIGNENSLSQFGMFAKYFSNQANFPIVLAGAFCMMIFVAGSNGITSTAISREGSNIYINKYLPIPYSTQIMAKVLSGVVFGVISEVIMILVAVTLLNLHLTIAILIFLLSILAIFYVCMVGIIIDLYNPKLEWANEQQAVKQNLNAFFEMLISWASIAIVMIPVIFLKFNLLFTILFIVVSFGIIDLILYKVITTKGEKRFAKLGE